MLIKKQRGISKLPRINFEVPAEIKKAVNKKCRIEGLSMRLVGTLLFKEWLSIPAIPESKIGIKGVK